MPAAECGPPSAARGHADPHALRHAAGEESAPGRRRPPSS